MFSEQQHKNSEAIPTIRLVTCPACNKPRLGKYVNEDGTVDPASEETVEVRGEKRFLEVCEFCIVKYQKRDKAFARENLKKLAIALKKNNVPDGESDHKDFSLN